MNRTRLKIKTVAKPLPRCTMWHGEAHTARRSYEWFFSDDTGCIRVRANRPEGSTFYWNLRKVPASFKVEIKRAVAAMQGGEA